MDTTSLFRQMFNLWERTTAAYLEALVRNPLYLTTAGTWMNWLFLTKKLTDSRMQSLWASCGLATRRDQEKMLHLLHKIDGRLEDLEFRMDHQTPSNAVA